MSNRKKVLAVSSAGGHWTQLLLLSDAFKHCDVRYVSTNINVSAIDTHKDLIKVIDADLSRKLKLIPLAVQMIVILLRHRPDIVISTGAAPGFFAIIMGKLIGAKTIWVDSMANYSVISISGKHASRFSDLCLTQWPDLVNGDRIRCSGSLL
jgi:UDP-N-acetylglucosamine:LPS N-acetylglucosamine transferase